jgi:preprotein translocase subunit SecD
MHRLFFAMICLMAASVMAADSPLEFRLIVPEGTPGAIRKLSDGRPLFCGSEVLMDVHAVRKAEVSDDPSLEPGLSVINITLNQEGKVKFGKITTQYQGERIGILSMGKLLVTPFIVEPITGGEVRISGDMTEAELEEIVNAINKAVRLPK